MPETSIARKGEWWPGRLFADWLEWPHLAALREGEKMLRIEEFREGDTLVIRSEMPGIDPDKDVQIEVGDHTLEIRAERREEKTTDDKGGRRSEFRYGSFFRAVPLPSDAKETDVRASYKDGVLEVRVPCAPSVGESPRRVEVTRG